MQFNVSKISPLSEKIYFWFWIILAIIVALFIAYGIFSVIRAKKGKLKLWQEISPSCIGLIICLLIGVAGVTTYALQEKEYHYKTVEFKNNIHDSDLHYFKDLEKSIKTFAEEEKLYREDLDPQLALRTNINLYRSQEEEKDAPNYMMIDKEGNIVEARADLMLVPVTRIELDENHSVKEVEREFGFYGRVSGTKTDELDISLIPFYLAQKNTYTRLTYDSANVGGYDPLLNGYDEFIRSNLINLSSLPDGGYLYLHFSFLASNVPMTFTTVESEESKSYDAVYTVDKSYVATSVDSFTYEPKEAGGAEIPYAYVEMATMDQEGNYTSPLSVYILNQLA